MDTPSKANDRFEAFMSEAKNTGRVWVLRNEAGYARWSSDDGISLPIWSQPEMAEQAAIRSFPDYQPEEMLLETFRFSVLPVLRDQEIWIGVNLTDDMYGVEIPCDEFEKNIFSHVP